ncbi:MAG: response regulator [Candidatus Helarchaeota archaeon]
MNVKILIVDDEHDTILLAKRILEPEGYQISVAYDGEEALEKIYREHPHIVLLDIKLPGKDGYEVCQEIKSNDELRDIIVIMFTVKAFDADRERGFQVGADYYITKPFSGAALIALIQKILEDLS